SCRSLTKQSSSLEAAVSMFPIYCSPTYLDKNPTLKLFIGSNKNMLLATIEGEKDKLVSPKFTSSPFHSITKSLFLLVLKVAFAIQVNFGENGYAASNSRPAL